VLRPLRSTPRNNDRNVGAPELRKVDTGTDKATLSASSPGQLGMAIDLDCTAARLQLEELESRSQALADGRLALQLLLQEQLGIDSTPQTTDILQSLLNASEEQQLQEQITSLSQFIAVAEGQQAALDSVAEEEAQQAASLQLATALQAQEEWDATVLRPHDAALARAIAGCTRAEWNEQGQMLQKPLDLTGRPTEPHDSKAAFRKACSTGKASGHTPAQDSTREPAGLSSGAAASASNSCQAGDLRAQCSSGSSSGTHSTGSGYVRQLMDALDGAVEPCERSEVEDIIRELYDEQLLPQREVKVRYCHHQVESLRKSIFNLVVIPRRCVNVNCSDCQPTSQPHTSLTVLHSSLAS